MLLSSRPGGSFIYYTIAIRKEKVEAGEFFTDFLKAFITFDMAYPIRGGDVTRGQKKEFLAEKWRIIHKNRAILNLVLILGKFFRSTCKKVVLIDRAKKPVWKARKGDTAND